jgi:hypothetical protein
LLFLSRFFFITNEERGEEEEKKKLNKAFISFMFQGMCVEAGVLHKKKAKKREKRTIAGL